MKSTTPLIASELRAEMARQQRTINDVARAASMTPSTLSRKLQGLYPFDVDELIRVAGVLGLTFSEVAARIEREEIAS